MKTTYTNRQAARAAKRAASRREARETFNAKRAEALALLARLTETLESEPRYQDRDDLNWGDTGTMQELAYRLGRFSDWAHNENEYQG